MKPKNHPSSLRFSPETTREIRRVAKRIRLSQQETIRRSVEKGLPLVEVIYAQ